MQKRIRESEEGGRNGGRNEGRKVREEGVQMRVLSRCLYVHQTISASEEVTSFSDVQSI